MTTEIRLLVGDDWQLWRDLRLQSLADTPEAFGSTLAREQAFSEETWRQRAQGGAVIAFVDGTPAALGSSFQPKPDWSHIVAMWTAPEFRRRGLATLVLDELVRRAKARGHRVVLDVAQGNSAARTAYERYGFVATGNAEPLREGSQIVCEEMILPN
jgi:predicted GNAT family acetyltransferase